MLISARNKLPRLFQPNNFYSKIIPGQKCLSTTEPERDTVLNRQRKIPKGPSLQHFLANAWGENSQNDSRRLGVRKTPIDSHPYLTEEMMRGDGLKGKQTSF